MTNKTISYIAKGVLLYITIFSVVILMSLSINFLSFFIWNLLNCLLTLMCVHCINKDEFLTITGNKFLSKHYPEMFDENE